MPHHTDEQAWAVWRAAAADPRIDALLGALYRDLDADIAARRPTCWLSGKCCKFESYGHRLYVTGLEIAWLLGQLDEAGRGRLAQALLPELDGCPFQVNGLCSVHALRPIGCRIYFCDPAAQGWQSDVYEAFLMRLRRLHEEHGLDYRYMEWRQGLADARRELQGEKCRLQNAGCRPDGVGDSA
jgi:Fe-S-cluster containining protein